MEKHPPSTKQKTIKRVRNENKIFSLSLCSKIFKYQDTNWNKLRVYLNESSFENVRELWVLVFLRAYWYKIEVNGVGGWKWKCEGESGKRIFHLIFYLSRILSVLFDYKPRRVFWRWIDKQELHTRPLFKGMKQRLLSTLDITHSLRNLKNGNKKAADLSNKTFSPFEISSS